MGRLDNQKFKKKLVPQKEGQVERHRSNINCIFGIIPPRWCSLLYGISTENLHKLQQNSLSHIVTRHLDCLSAHSWLIHLHWLAVWKRTEFKITKLTYKILATHQPMVLTFITLCFHTGLLTLCTLLISNFFKSHTWTPSLVVIASDTVHPRYGMKSCHYQSFHYISYGTFKCRLKSYLPSQLAIHWRCLSTWRMPLPLISEISSTLCVASYIIMAALRSSCGHYIFVLWFLLLLLSSSFFLA